MERRVKVYLVVILTFVVWLHLAFNTSILKQPGQKCTINLEIVNSSSDQNVLATYHFENLSSEGKYLTRKAIENGNFAPPNPHGDQEIIAEDFRYWDEASKYKILNDGMNYTMITYSTSKGSCQYEK